jgi:YidC/Oxa1 family membrane protein insertase
MRKMQKLAPELKKLRETVKDKQQQQLKMMEMYKKHGVNPFGGCFPMLAQMPIFIGLYSALMSAVELRHAPFALWIHDLSAKEALMVGGFGIPVMVILMVITMLIQQMMTPVADPAQKKMMMFMPFIFGFMFSGFPAGLTLYWLTNNIVSIVQQRTFYTEKGKGHGVAITFAACAAVFSVVYIMTLIG